MYLWNIYIYLWIFKLAVSAFILSTYIFLDRAKWLTFYIKHILWQHLVKTIFILNWIHTEKDCVIFHIHKKYFFTTRNFTKLWMRRFYALINVHGKIILKCLVATHALYRQTQLNAFKHTDIHTYLGFSMVDRLTSYLTLAVLEQTLA